MVPPFETRTTALALCAFAVQCGAYTLRDDDRLRIGASLSNLFWMLAALGLHDLAGAAISALGCARGFVAVRAQGHARANPLLYGGFALLFAVLICVFAWKDAATPIAAAAGGLNIFASFCLQAAALRWGVLASTLLFAVYWACHAAPLQLIGALTAAGVLWWRARAI